MIDNELTTAEHELLRKHPKEIHEAVFMVRLYKDEGYYMFYIYPSYIKLIGKNNGVKLYHLHYGVTLGLDMQRAMYQATGYWLLQRDIKQRFYGGQPTQKAHSNAINQRMAA
tara:strand:+ start:55 stop:390 length:336 start_codon:yes stop_codon:yes gene_type:complete